MNNDFGSRNMLRFDRGYSSTFTEPTTLHKASCQKERKNKVYSEMLKKKTRIAYNSMGEPRRVVVSLDIEKQEASRANFSKKTNNEHEAHQKLCFSQNDRILFGKDYFIKVPGGSFMTNFVSKGKSLKSCVPFKRKVSRRRINSYHKPRVQNTITLQSCQDRPKTPLHIYDQELHYELENMNKIIYDEPLILESSERIKEVHNSNNDTYGHSVYIECPNTEPLKNKLECLRGPLARKPFAPLNYSKKTKVQSIDGRHQKQISTHLDTSKQNQKCTRNLVTLEHNEHGDSTTSQESKIDDNLELDIYDNVSNDTNISPSNDKMILSQDEVNENRPSPNQLIYNDNENQRTSSCRYDGFNSDESSDSESKDFSDDFEVNLSQLLASDCNPSQETCKDSKKIENKIACITIQKQWRQFMDFKQQRQQKMIAVEVKVLMTKYCHTKSCNFLYTVHAEVMKRLTAALIIKKSLIIKFRCKQRMKRYNQDITIKKILLNRWLINSIKKKMGRCHIAILQRYKDLPNFLHPLNTIEKKCDISMIKSELGSGTNALSLVSTRNENNPDIMLSKNDYKSFTELLLTDKLDWDSFFKEKECSFLRIASKFFSVHDDLNLFRKARHLLKESEIRELAEIASIQMRHYLRQELLRSKHGETEIMNGFNSKRFDIKKEITFSIEDLKCGFEFLVRKTMLVSKPMTPFEKRPCSVISSSRKTPDKRPMSAVPYRLKTKRPPTIYYTLTK